jgi:tetratricopeptide (TPR) repeat protein
MALGELNKGDDFNGAAAAYRKMIAEEAMAHSNLGNLRHKFQDYDGAKASYGCAIKADPNYAMAHYNLGSLLDELKDYDGAKASYGRAIEADPKLANAHCNLGLLLADKFQDYDGAKASYGRAIKADPNHPSVMLRIISTRRLSRAPPRSPCATPYMTSYIYR